MEAEDLQLWRSTTTTTPNNSAQKKEKTRVLVNIVAALFVLCKAICVRMRQWWKRGINLQAVQRGGWGFHEKAVQRPQLTKHKSRAAEKITYTWRLCCKSHSSSRFFFSSLSLWRKWNQKNAYRTHIGEKIHGQTCEDGIELWLTDLFKCT